MRSTHVPATRAKKARVAAVLRFLVLAGLLAAAWLLAALTGIVSEPAWIRDALFVVVFLLGGRWLLVRKRPAKIPVLNYHSVSPCPDWLPNGDRISVSPALLEMQLRHLKKHNYQSLFLPELCELLAGPDQPSDRRKRVALTFDDGYADNWIAAYPLLARHGLRATFFVAVDFVDPRSGTRRTLDELRADETPEENQLEWEGYLSWEEMREMERRGFGRIEAHGEQHTRVYSDSNVVGFNSPDSTDIWAVWNADRAGKPFWWKAQTTAESLWGTPIYPRAPALVQRAFLPDSGLAERLREVVRDSGAGFFERTDWRRTLEKECRVYADARRDAGRRETEQEYLVRTETDLRNCRAALGKELGREIRYLCWPENRFDEKSESIAARIGYRATVSSYHDTRNAPGEEPTRIGRIAVTSRAAGFSSPRLDYLVFVMALKTYEGHYWLYPFLAAATLLRKLSLGKRT